MPNAAGPKSTRVVWIETVPTPFRCAQHERMCGAMPTVQFHFVYTHSAPDQDWRTRPEEGSLSVGVCTTDAIAHQGRVRTWLHAWRKGGRIIREALSPRPGAVIVSGYADPGRARVIEWCRRSAVPLILQADSNIECDQAAGIKRLVKTALVRRVVRASSAIIVFGSAGRAYFRRYGAADEMIFDVPGECMEDAFRTPATPPLAALAARLAHDAEASTNARADRILFCGRLIDRKRCDLAIAAFVAIAQERPEWQLLVIGDGPRRLSLQAMVPNDLRNRVRFLGFIEDHQVTAAIFRSSKVLVHPADNEPWGLIVHEALAAGLGVITTRAVGAAQDMILSADAGTIVPTGDLPALAAALRDATSPERAARFPSAAEASLEAWKSRVDPVRGLRSALTSVGAMVEVKPLPAAATSLR